MAATGGSGAEGRDDGARRLPADRTWGVWAAVAAAAVILHLLRYALLPFVLAAILGFVTDPLIRRLQRWTGAPRLPVAAGLYVVIVLGLGALAAAVGWAAIQDASHAAAAGTKPLQDGLRAILGDRGLTLFGARVDADTAIAFLQEQAHRFLNAALLLRAGRPALEAMVGVVLLVFLAFYAMLSGPELSRGALWLIPPTRRRAVERVAPAMVAAVQRYFIGIVVIVGFTTVAAFIGYGLVLHVRNALALSVAVGLLETIPAVGAATAAVLVALSALQLHSLVTAVAMVAYAAALRLGVDDVVAPVVLGRSVAVHPAVVMLAYVVGAVLYGVAGLLLAVPVAACLRIALQAAYRDDGTEVEGKARPRR